MPGDKSLIYTITHDNKIYAVNSDNTQKKTLTSGPAGTRLECPDVQRQGAKIAYMQSDAATYSQIITMNLDGSGKKSVALAPHDGLVQLCPKWSPDGKKIAYYRHSYQSDGKGGYNHVADLMVANADGSGTVKVANSFTTSINSSNPYSAASLESVYAWQLSFPTPWSPGNTSLLIKKVTGNVENLYHINIATKKLTAVTKNTSTSTRIEQYGWSPDRRIVFTYGPATAQTVVKSVRTDGTSSKILYQAKTGEAIEGLMF